MLGARVRIGFFRGEGRERTHDDADELQPVHPRLHESVHGFLAGLFVVFVLVLLGPFGGVLDEYAIKKIIEGKVKGHCSGRSDSRQSLESEVAAAARTAVACLLDSLAASESSEIIGCKSSGRSIRLKPDLDPTRFKFAIPRRFDARDFFQNHSNSNNDQE